MKKMSLVIGLVCFWLATAYAEPAPDFSLKDLGGAPVSLSSFKGKIVVIDFWAMWCHACKDAFGELNAINKEFSEKGVVVVGINLEKANPEKVAAFVKKAQIAYTVLPDPQSSTAKLFGVKGVPTLVVVDQKQNIVKTFRGINGSTKKEIIALLEQLVQAK